MNQKEDNEYMVVFTSQGQGIFLYNELIKKGFQVQFASAPCTLAIGCSKCIKFSERYMDQIVDEIEKNKIKMRGIYKIVKNYTGNTKYVRVKGPEN